MNEIVYPMKVHAVKLEYRRLKLEQMVQGYFKSVNGETYVYITLDPKYSKCDSKHPRRLKVKSRTGKKYASEVSAYLKLKEEYNNLLNSWYSIYSFEPPAVRFPIIQYYDPHQMNNAFFEAQADCVGKHKADNPTVSEHGELKIQERANRR